MSNKPKTKKKTRIRIYKMLFIVFSIGFIVSVTLMVSNWWDEWQAQKKFESLMQNTETESEIASEIVPETETETELDALAQMGITVPEKNLDWNALWEQNKDIYAWIYIPNTNIDYPVLQHATDDTYYLEYNLDGSKGRPGCIYSEHKYNSKDFMDFNTALYGHNMRVGTMFATLHNFEDSTFFNENRYIYIYMPDGTVYVYDIFAAYTSSDRHIMAYYSFISEYGRQEYLDDVFGIRDMSAHFREGVEVTTDSKILSLITCVRGQSSKRYFVQGVLVNPPVEVEVE